jgi:deoxyuridine 5'-triphosphate nucleotidohydrolase
MDYTRPFGYCLTRKVKDPEYGTEKAGCLDFFVPEFDEEFLAALRAKNDWITDYDFLDIKTFNQVVIRPGQDLNVPSGVHVKLDDNTALTAFNKSGIATKFKLVRGAEYVDSDYQGEIHLHVMNVGSKDVRIFPGMKLVQFSYVPVFRADKKRFGTLAEMYTEKTQRGEGAFGSTGLK